MKAVVATREGGPEVLEYRDVGDPAPADGEVVVRTEAIGVNFADIAVREGRYHAAGRPPVVPGFDVAGTVAAVGPAAGGFEVGQRVAAYVPWGGYAELCAAPVAMTWKLPDHVDSEAGAYFPLVGVTGFNVLTRAGRLEPGDTVLVHAAAGGLGTMVIQLARALGAGRVFGTVGDDAKVAVARQAGCDEVVNYRTEDFAHRVRELTDGRGVDLIVDSVSGSVSEQGLTCLAAGGRLVVCGMASGEPGRFTTEDVRSTNRAVVGYSTGSYRTVHPERLTEAGQEVLGLLAGGSVRPVIGARFPLRDAAKAHRLLEGRRSVGKILLVP